MTTANDRRKRVADAIEAFVENPFVNFVVGLILLISGVSDSYGNFAHDLSHPRLRVHHGMIVLGLFRSLASLPEIINGLDAGRKYLTYRAGRQ